MNILLSPKTQKLLEARMKKVGKEDADAVVRQALETLDRVEGEAIEDLDEPTRKALERAEKQSLSRQGRPWKDVKSELRNRFLKR